MLIPMLNLLRDKSTQRLKHRIKLLLFYQNMFVLIKLKKKIQQYKCSRVEVMQHKQANLLLMRTLNFYVRKRFRYIFLTKTNI